MDIRPLSVFVHAQTPHGCRLPPIAKTSGKPAKSENGASPHLRTNGKKRKRREKRIRFPSSRLYFFFFLIYCPRQFDGSKNRLFWRCSVIIFLTDKRTQFIKMINFSNDFFLKFPRYFLFYIFLFIPVQLAVIEIICAFI